MGKVQGKIRFVSFMGHVFLDQRSTINSTKIKVGVKNEFISLFLQEDFIRDERRLRKLKECLSLLGK